MIRFKHYLRRNATSRRPSRLVFLDVDSDERKTDSGNIVEEYKSAALVSVRRGKRGYTSSATRTFDADRGAVWDAIVAQAANRVRTLVVCPKPVRVLTLLRHVDEMQRRGWTLDTPTSSARFTAIAWKNDKKSLLFVAHSNLFPMHRLKNGDAAYRAEQMRDTWLEYFELLDDVGAGDFHLSLGAQALGIFRHRFMQHALLLHGNARVDEIEQRACLGALYQPYFFGAAPADKYYYLDTNAMYPAMMKAWPVPWRLVGRAGRYSVALLDDKLKRFAGIATVRIATDDPHYPVRHEARTVFPIGEFNTTLTTPDLRYALMAHHVQDVYAFAWYDSAKLFTDFVNFFWRKRREYNEHGKPLWASWSKSMMVALYGKFGCHTFETRCEGENPFDCDQADQMASLDSDKTRWYHTLAGKMWSSARTGLNDDAFPAIMAHVAAYGRNRMMYLIQHAGLENVFACLSDGLIVNQRGYDALQREIMPDELGMLKLKLCGDELEIWSDVEYRLGVREWRPGVKPDAIQIDDGVFVEYLDPSLTTLSRCGDAQTYIRQRRQVCLTRTIRTGQVTKSGRIAPLQVFQPPL